MGKQLHKSLHYFALALAFLTFLLVIVGALVTSNDAGLSVPDWPLSHGQLMPEMVGGVFYEHGHRMVAATVGLLTIVLNIWLWRTEPRLWVRRLGLIALATVMAQGVLGGITVLFFLPTPISVLHASVAALFFCLMITLAVVTSPGWLNLSQSLMQGWRGILKCGNSELKLAVFNTLAVYLQYILGATVRHSGTVDGTKGAVLVTSALAVHLVGAILLTGLILFVSRALIRRIDDRGIVQLVYLQLGLLLTQLLLGLGAYWVRIDAANQVQPTVQKVVLATSHLAVGTLLLAVTLVVMLRLVLKVMSAVQELVQEPTLAGELS